MRPPRGSETVLQHGTPYSPRLPPRVGSTLLDGTPLFRGSGSTMATTTLRIPLATIASAQEGVRP